MFNRVETRHSLPACDCCFYFYLFFVGLRMIFDCATVLYIYIYAGERKKTKLVEEENGSTVFENGRRRAGPPLSSY